MKEGVGGDFQKQQFELKVENQLNIGNKNANPSFNEQTSRKEFQSFLNQHEFSSEDDEGQTKNKQLTNGQFKKQGIDRHSITQLSQNPLTNNNIILGQKDHDQQQTNSNVPPISLDFNNHNNSQQFDSVRGNHGIQQGSSHGEETGVFGSKNAAFSSQRIPSKECRIQDSSNDEKLKDNVLPDDIVDNNQHSSVSSHRQLKSKSFLSGSSKNIQQIIPNNKKNFQEDENATYPIDSSKPGQRNVHSQSMILNDLSQISQNSNSRKQFNSFAHPNQGLLKNANAKSFLEEVFGDIKKEPNEYVSSNLHNSSQDYMSINNTMKEHFDSSMIHNSSTISNTNKNNTNNSNILSHHTNNNNNSQNSNNMNVENVIHKIIQNTIMDHTKDQYQQQDSIKQQEQQQQNQVPSRVPSSYEIHDINEESNNEKESITSQRPRVITAEQVQAQKDENSKENVSMNHAIKGNAMEDKEKQDQEFFYERSQVNQRFTLGQLPVQSKPLSPEKKQQPSSPTKEGSLFRTSEGAFLFQSHQTDIHKRQTSEASDIFETESTRTGYWKEKYEIVASKERQYKKSIDDQHSALQALKSDINKIEFLHRMEKFPMMRSQSGSETSEEANKIQTWHVIIFGILSFGFGYILKRLTL